MAAAELLKIGDVAARSGLTVKTIRFYCDEGLIHPASRSDGGFRLFSPDVFEELTFIRTLRALEIPGPINGLSPEALIPVSAWGFVGKFRS